MVKNKVLSKFISHIKSLGIYIDSEELIFGLINDSKEDYWREDFMQLVTRGHYHGILFRLKHKGIFQFFSVNTKNHLHCKVKVIFRVYGFEVSDAENFIKNINYIKVNTAQ